MSRAEPPGRADLVGGLLIATASFLFGSVVILGKVALRRGLSVPPLLATRYAVAAVVLVIALLALRRPMLPAKGERAGVVLLGMFLYALESGLFFTALQYGTAAAVTLLFFTYPVFVTLASWIVGQERPSRWTMLALACAVLGSALVVGTGGGLAIQTAGVLFALGSATAYTVYLMGADRVLRRTNPLTSATWVSAGASLGLVAFAMVRGDAQVPSGWSEWLPLLGMGLATAGAFVCLMTGLQRIGPVRSSIVAALEPLAAAVLGSVFLGESLAAGTVAGGVLILAGAVTASLGRAATVQEQQIP